MKVKTTDKKVKKNKAKSVTGHGGPRVARPPIFSRKKVH
jgi:hypothetical protein